MEPTKFKESNMKWIGNPENNVGDLDARKEGEDSKTIIYSCWRASWKERLRILITGRVWVYQLTFDNALQPQGVSADKPFKSDGPYNKPNE